MSHKVTVEVRNEVVWTEVCKDLRDAQQFFDLMVECKLDSPWEKLLLVTPEKEVIREVKR
jgi:hypothetical protein